MLTNTFSLNSGYGQSSLESSKNQVFYLVTYTPSGLHEHMNNLFGEWRLSITACSEQATFGHEPIYVGVCHEGARTPVTSGSSLEAMLNGEPELRERLNSVESQKDCSVMVRFRHR